MATSVLFLSLTASSLFTIIANRSDMTLQPSRDTPNTAKDDHFPRVLHYLWPNKDFSFGADDPDGIEQQRTHEFVTRIKANNPEWQVKIWTDDECFALVKQDFPDYYQHWKSKLNPKLKMWDAVRPMILYQHGGLYLDHDIDCDEGVHFDDWITPKTTLLLRGPQSFGQTLGNHLMGSVEKHPIWKLYLDNIVKATPKNPSVIRHTGPKQLYLTFSQYEKNVKDRSSITLIGFNHIGTRRECQEAFENETVCEQPRCRHIHSVSPAELAGEDDNAKGQIKSFQKRIGVVEQHRALKMYHTLDCACQKLPKWMNVTNHKGIFIHIPKTGGTTIERLMGIKGSCHATAADVRDCSPADYDNALTFAVLRNPIERAISIYRYAKSGGNKTRRDKDKFGWTTNLSFPDFVKALPAQQEANFAPQSHFIVDDNGKLLVNEVLCTKRLAAGWQRLSALEPKFLTYGDFPRFRCRKTPSDIEQVTDDQLDAETEKGLREFYSNDFGLWQKYCDNKQSTY